jgi:hypothetical protein
MLDGLKCGPHKSKAGISLSGHARLSETILASIVRISGEINRNHHKVKLEQVYEQANLLIYGERYK